MRACVRRILLRHAAIAALCLSVLCLGAGRPRAAEGPGESLRDTVERFATDQSALERSYRSEISVAASERRRGFLAEELRRLEATPFQPLGQAGRIDYLLLRGYLRFGLRQIARERARVAEVSGLLPFAQPVLDLEESRRRVEPVDSERAARTLVQIREAVDQARKGLEGALEKQGRSPAGGDAALPGRVAAARAAGFVDELVRTLGAWRGFYAGYDPVFTWWTRDPYPAAEKALKGYAAFLRTRLAGFTEGTEDPILGDPIGREALVDSLEREMIPYSPEELIEIANRELAWCDEEMRKAARDLGFGDDTKRALEHVKNLHVQPGEQPKLIKQLAEEAIQFVESRQLVTVPPLAKEIWRMEMMSPERQLVNPFFTGGEVVSVSFPTDTMSHEDKLMSLRGNNVHFSRATVHHELIPGHHLQGFMASRFATHRRLFRTPFLVEGWALYWEMLLWDLGFPRSPEDRIGMLFWRSHRCARIIFSLNFHLGKMTPQEAIDFLVDRIGHERSNATAEVRRSVGGAYEPLYQAAYMLGGLQIRALRRELVESGKMSDREMHDAILKENAIPIEMIRASLTSQPLDPGFSSRWRFHGETSIAREAIPQKSDAKPGPSAPKVYGDFVEPHWIQGGTRLWYRASRSGDRSEIILVDAAAGARGPAFDHPRMASALSKPLGKELAPDRLPIESIEYSPDGKSVRVRVEKRSWDCNLATYELTEGPVTPPDESKEPPRGSRRGRRGERPSTKSPDGRLEAFVRDHNLFLRDLETKKEDALSTDGAPLDSYARDVRRERSVDLDYDLPDPGSPAPEVFWSPDSRFVVATRTRPGTERTVYLIESSPKDQLQPRLQSYPYLKPGDDVPIAKPHLFQVEGRREIPVDDSLFRTPWSIGGVLWSPDSSRFTFLYNERGHQVFRFVGVSAPGGEAKAIIDELSSTFIDYAGKFYLDILDATGEVLWMSERDGWNHLYLYDGSTGRLKNRVTSGEWVVRGVERVDSEARQVWFRAGGIRKEQDPYYIHFCRVGLDGTGLVVLTEGDGMHSVQPSPDRRFFVDTYSRVDAAPVTELRSMSDGRLVCVLEKADTGELDASGWRAPERFAAKGRDGQTDIYGVIHYPTGFDPTKSYPVIENIYAGPQDSYVPKSFRAASRHRDLTDAGFFVVQMDGMGTSNRSKAFHDVCWKNLGDAGLPDRIAWMKAAALKHPSMDLTRVGVFGGSAGGQNAVGALLTRGDFYKVGVADCGCHDNRMDKIWWNELWMGWPIGPHYAAQSNVTLAPRLTGKLLLFVGELDRNVDPASTMQLVNALIKADRDFDMLVVPGAGHGAGEGPYGRRKRLQFFRRHLLGVPVESLEPAELPVRSF